MYEYQIFLYYVGCDMVLVRDSLTRENIDV